MSYDVEHVGFGQFPAPVEAELRALRKKVWGLLAIHPMSDPHRVNFAGVPVPREQIDELKVITFPGIIFESLPVVMKKGGLGGVKYYVWDRGLREPGTLCHDEAIQGICETKLVP
jgi:hypothetical protein